MSCLGFIANCAIPDKWQDLYASLMINLLRVSITVFFYLLFSKVLIYDSDEEDPGDLRAKVRQEQQERKARQIPLFKSDTTETLKKDEEERLRQLQQTKAKPAAVATVAPLPKFSFGPSFAFEGGPTQQPLTVTRPRQQRQKKQLQKTTAITSRNNPKPMDEFPDD